MLAAEDYSPDRSLKGKLRRRFVRLQERRPAQVRLTRPMVSFTFDDVPISAIETAGAMLEAKGARGTYFVCAGLAGQDSRMGRYAAREDILAAQAKGHEIACHTFHHLDCGAADALAIETDIACNDAALADWGVEPTATFAYPYGDVSRAAKQVSGVRFALARALHHGLIETGADLNQAPAVGIEGPDGGEVALRWLERAAARKAWLILYTHDVRQNPSPVGCTPETFQQVLDAAVRLGFDLVTVAEGARRIGA
jgi:peptidoglycan/xylan/chitin deacetylase (PgdA/CDA1 family)